MVRGDAFVGDDLLDAGGIIDYLTDVSTEEEFESRVADLNGFFQIVHHSGEKTFAAVDRIASMPLFFDTREDETYLSDDPEWIRENIQNVSIDSVSRAELALSGFVSGKSTKYQSLHQLRAGAILTLDDEVSVSHYYRYDHDKEPLPKADRREKLEDALVTSFDRLIEYADGRTILVSLSGGYDSRLILLMLDRLGYDDVLSFNIGQPESRQAELSRTVAENLGVEWIQVPAYSSDYYEVFRTERRREYDEYPPAKTVGYERQPFALHHLSYLQDENLLPDDFVLVTGHSADFLAGRQIPGQFSEVESLNKEAYLDIVMDSVYSLWDCATPSMEERIRERVWARTDADSIRSVEEGLRAFEEMDWRDRHAKVFNSPTYVWEFYGFDWWLPYWDATYLEFWEQIPVSDKFDQRLYNEFVRDLYVERSDVDPDSAERTENEIGDGIVPQIKEKILGTRLEPPARRVRNFITSPPDRYTQNQLFGILERSQFEQLYTGEQSIHSFLALEAADRLSIDPPGYHPVGDEVYFPEESDRHSSDDSG
jgi:asparagine synthase (glutamine-hydrolysing)